MGLLSSRRESAESRLTALQQSLAKANELVQGNACVYVTGSLARGEASEYSDLDLFIAGYGSHDRRAPTRLDEILVKAKLIEVTRTLEFPEFSGDGEYLQHYKLKHSRLLTCYSALAHLLAVFTKKGTVTQQDAKAMVALSPTARLEQLADQFPAARTHVANILSIYEEFLQNTDAPESTMVERFQDPGHIRKCSETAGRLSEEMFDLIEGIGNKSQFHRLLLV